MQQALGGAFRILYAAPERLETESFVALSQRLDVRLVAVDEAHCVSQWGQDFRPSYLKIAAFLARLPRRPAVGAFTATATEQVRQDIIRLLGLRDPLCLTTGFDRPNLYFAVARPRDKERYIEEYVLDHPDKSGIVYCATRKSVESLCRQLQAAGHPGHPLPRRAGGRRTRPKPGGFRLRPPPRHGRDQRVGMGIDKSNVSFVLHYNMPKNLENYYQEAGRAGRDGAKAECILLFSLGDIQTARYFIKNSRENDELTPEEAEAAEARDLERLERMVGYCKTTRCLRGYLLAYFGETHTGKCGNCGNCCGDFVETDITTEAQKILSGLARIENAGPAGSASLRWCRCCAAAATRTRCAAGWTNCPPTAS